MHIGSGHEHNKQGIKQQDICEVLNIYDIPESYSIDSRKLIQ